MRRPRAPSWWNRGNDSQQYDEGTRTASSTVIAARSRTAARALRAAGGGRVSHRPWRGRRQFPCRRFRGADPARRARRAGQTWSAQAQALDVRRTDRSGGRRLPCRPARFRGSRRPHALVENRRLPAGIAQVQGIRRARRHPCALGVRPDSRAGGLAALLRHTGAAPGGNDAARVQPGAGAIDRSAGTGRPARGGRVPARAARRAARRIRPARRGAGPLHARRRSALPRPVRLRHDRENFALRSIPAVRTGVRRRADRAPDEGSALDGRGYRAAFARRSQVSAMRGPD